MATLEYDFRIIGMSAVEKAFASLERRAKTHNDRLAQLYGQPARGGAMRQTGGRGAAPPPPPRRTPADAQRQEQQRAAREQKRQEERAAREQQRLIDRQLRMEERAARQRERMREQEWNRKQDHYRKEEKAATRAYEREQAQIVSRRRRRMGIIAGAVGETVSTIGGKALSLAQVGAGGLIAAGINAGRTAYRASTALAAQSKQAGNKASMREIHEGILKDAAQVTQATGVSRGTVIQSMSAFHGVAGNLAAAKELAPYMAVAAEAADADPKDIAKLAGMTFMRAQAKGMSAKEAAQAAKDIVGTFASHAAKGTIEMADYAAVGPEILAAASQMMGTEGFVQTAAIASAIAQGSIGGGSSSAAEAATATSRLVDDLTQNYDKIKKQTGFETMGVDPKTGLRKLKGFEDTIPALLALAKGDVSNLMKMGIDVRGNRAMKGFLDKYAEGTKRLGPGTAEEKGATAVREAILEATKGRISEGDFAAMAKAREELDPYAKMEKAIIRLADTAMPPLTRAVEKLAAKLESPEAQKAVETGGEILETIVENPKTALGVYAGGTFLTSVLGGAASSYIAGLFGGGTAAATAGAGAGAGGAAGLGALGATAAMVTGAGAAGLAGLGALLAGSVGAAGYNAFQLYKEMNVPLMEGGTATGPAPGQDKAKNEQATKAGEAIAQVIKPAADGLNGAADALKAVAGIFGSSGGGTLNRTDAPGQPSPSAGGR
jgi:hypothetical protein